MKTPPSSPVKELLGREGRRVKDCYRREAARTGVEWRGRQYNPGDFDSGDPVNQAVTAAAQCMYGIAHVVVAALGCSPGLGFVHSGHELSFVMDVADLYKTELGIPLAFDTAAEGWEDVGSRTRRALRDRINKTGLLERCVNDIKALLASGVDPERSASGDQVLLQSDRGIEFAGGHNHAVQETW